MEFQSVGESEREWEREGKAAFQWRHIWGNDKNSYRYLRYAYGSTWDSGWPSCIYNLWYPYLTYLSTWWVYILAELRKFTTLKPPLINSNSLHLRKGHHRFWHLSRYLTRLLSRGIESWEILGNSPTEYGWLWFPISIVIFPRYIVIFYHTHNINDIWFSMIEYYSPIMGL